ncbi:MAG: TonB-dependent receptor, partial [Flavobacteriales bacterium]|nr:TonB-dependent receptor [Flavobacteriales bacterium]
SFFAHVGPYTKYTPQDGGELNLAQPPEVTEYANGDVVGTYLKLEPRINMRLEIDNQSSVKAGYTHNYQYLHLTSLSATSLPTDVWIPSTDIVQPQFGIQYSVGYFRNFLDNQFESSIELYYKDMDNLIEYKEGTLPEDNVNDNIDNLLVFGQGYSYGAEFFLKKRLGDFNGWIGYTWSKTMRQFDEINEGEEYPAKFDRRHDLSVILNYDLNEKWNFGGAFVYATGNAITLPLERYFYEGSILEQFGARNSFRMAPYHRADVSVSYTPSNMKQYKNAEGEKVQKPRKFFSSWTLSVYNLYNRQNPYFIYFGNDGQLQEGSLQIKAYQVSLFPILPSITWNFKF